MVSGPPSGGDRLRRDSARVVGPTPPTACDPLEKLRDQLRRLESRPMVTHDSSPVVFSSGGDVLDQCLPHRGLRPGTLVEWVEATPACGASTLAMIAASRIMGSPASAGKCLVLIDGGNPHGQFYPPSALSLAIPADRMVLVQAKQGLGRADQIWSLDQALRSDAVAAVWAEVGDWLDDRDARRLQLAAEAGGTVGLLVRPPATARRPSFADIRWRVAKIGSMWRLELQRCRGGSVGAVAMVQLDANGLEIQTGATTDSAISASAKHESTMAGDLAHRLAHPMPGPVRKHVNRRVG